MNLKHGLQKRFLACFLILAMVMTMIPGSVWAETTGNDRSPSVKEGEITLSMRLNDWEDIDLSEYFKDPDGGTLTYQVSYDNQTWESASEQFAYYPAGSGEQQAWFKAVDSQGNESDPVHLTASVEKPPKQVDVTMSVTQGTDRIYYCEESGSLMVPTEMTVPYFDLSLYGLEDYYYNPKCYSTHKEGDTEYENSQLMGTKETARNIVTVMHAFIYMTEVYYLDYDPEDAGTGLSYETGEFQEAVSWTGNAGSTFMDLWDHGTNLNYYVDWDYPLGAHKWGSTSDQIALYGGEDISIHMIKSSSASGSQFAYFTADGTCDAASQVDEITIEKGKDAVLTVVSSQPDWEGAYETEHVPYAGKNWVWCEVGDETSCLKEWNAESFGGNETLKTDDKGQITLDTSKLATGEYYIAVYGSMNDDGSAETGPAMVKVNVICQHEYNDATCSQPKTCKHCGKTEGKATGHRWTAATCEAPKTCTACGATEGDADADAHSFVEGVCTVCGKTAAADNFENPPALAGGASASVLEEQYALYEMNLSTVFTDSAAYTVSVDGGEAVPCREKYSYSCDTVGAHKLVFTAINSKGSSPTYTVNLTAVPKDAVQEVNHKVKGGTIKWFAFTDENYNPLPADTTYSWDGEKYTFTITQPADINLTGKVLTFYKLEKDTAGAKLPLLTGSTATSGAGTWWDKGVRDRQTVTLFNGEQDAHVYLYENAASHASNVFETVKFDFNRTKSKSYFEYQTSGYYTYTIAGETGGVNGHSWITSDEVHVALKDTTPADLQLFFLEQKTATTLSGGDGSYTWGTKTIKYKIDEIPALADGHPSTAIGNVEAGNPYVTDLSTMFTDADENDKVSYRVKINGGNMKKVSGTSYSYTPSVPGTYTLEFFAYDGFVYSEDSYTVTLTALNMSETFDVTVNNLPEGAEFYYNNGFNTDGTDILGGQLEADYEDEIYTVKVPANINCIAIKVGERRITAEVSAENNVLTMQKTTFLVNTKAGDKADGTVSVTYGSGHKAIGKDNVYYLVSGSGYLFQAVPSKAYSSRWTSGGKAEPITTEKEATITVTLEVNTPKNITVDKDADLTVYYQWGYYRMYEVEPALEKDNGDNTITYTYPCPESQVYARGYMYFATKGDLIDKAGYMNSVTNTTVTWDGETRKSDHRGTNRNGVLQTGRTDDSVMVNINAQNHLVLDSGDTFRLRAFRIWEIINTDTENVMIEPQFTYTNYDEDMVSLVTANEALAASGSNQLCGTGGNNWMDMTVKSAGTTFMEVGYEAIHIVDGYEAGAWGGAGGQAGDFLFSACDPARTALIVIQTDGKAATDVDFGIKCYSSFVGDENYYTGKGLKKWDVEFDTLYFLGESGEMEFAPSAKSGEIASVAVSADKGETWTEVKGKNGVYTADIYSGNNVIRVTKADGTTAYQVVRGDKITYKTSLINDSDNDGQITPGDTVRVKLNGLHNPVGKMSGIYNPGFSRGQRVAYTWDDQQVRQGSYHQYDFVTNSEIDVTIPQDAEGNYSLTEGYIHFNIFGDMPGSHRELTDGGRAVNTTAESGCHTRSLLPDILVYQDPDYVEVVKGDINGDNEVDTNDAATVISYYYGDVELTEEQLELADVTGDGEVDTNDAGMMISYYYGNISGF